MTETITQRRNPVQARSRETVTRILGATEDLIAAEGVDAVTTRAVAERAGVSVPSLYRFFADRDEILDRLLSNMLADLDEHAGAMESEWEATSLRDFVTMELDLHVAYYQRHPSYVRLWYGGRVSPVVVAEVHKRNRELGHRARSVLVAAGLVEPDVAEGAFVLLVELGDRVLDVAFRDRRRPDPSVIEDGREALIAYLERIAAPDA